MARTKGASGEREVCTAIALLTGWEVKRRVRNHAGDSDLVGVPGWAVEVKRHATASRGSVRAWWAQAVEQSNRTAEIPVLFWRADRDEWRAVWPVSLSVGAAGHWHEYSMTVEGTVAAWAAVARDEVKIEA